MSFKEVMLKAQEETAKREQHYEAVREKRKQEIREIIEGFESSPRNRRASNIKRAFKENCHRNIKVNGPLVAKRLLQAQQASGLSPTRYCDSIKMQLEIFRYLTEQKPNLISASEQRILIAAGVFNDPIIKSPDKGKKTVQIEPEAPWTDEELDMLQNGLTLDELCAAMPNRNRHSILKRMPKVQQKKKQWITNTEAAKMMDCSLATITNLCKTKQIPTRLINGKRRIPPDWKPKPLPAWEAVTIIEAVEMVGDKINPTSFTRYWQKGELEGYKYLDRIYLRKEQIKLLAKHIDDNAPKNRKHIQWGRFQREWLLYLSSV